MTDARRNEALRAANRPRRRGARTSWLWEWIKVFPAAVLLFLVLRTFLVEAYTIPTASMERTLLVGDFLLVSKLAYGADVPFTSARLPGVRAPRRGDVVVFEYPVDPSKNYVKRLVGLPGDTIAMQGGVLIRNGARLAEPYATHSAPGIDPVLEAFAWQQLFARDATSREGAPSRDNWGPIVVPARQYFVLGDNRDNSEDSRYWGFVPDSLMVGTPLFIYFSIHSAARDSASWLSRVRWGRVGTAIR